MISLCVFVGFSSFCRHFGRLEVLEPKPPFVLFYPQNRPLYTPKTLRFKGEMSSLDTETTIKLGK